jgi:rod shape-determining protein MreC
VEFLKNHKKFFIAAIIVVCILCAIVTLGRKYQPTLVNNTLGFIITPVEGAITGVGAFISARIDFIVRMGEIEAENIELKERVKTLEADNTRLSLVDKENQKLSELLEIDRQYANYPMVGANVIAKDTGNWYNTFTIDKGTRDGFQKDMVVLASGGLVGRIFEAGYNYSKVLSIIDDTSAVAVKIARTEDDGYIRGDLYLMLEGKCRMEFIDSESDLLQGDEIVTAPTSSIYPPGIIIGHVLSVSMDANGTKSAIIEPFVDFKHIEKVIVVTALFEQELIPAGETE